jgi:5-formyltetrahydrofolate cyclo-ligase
MPSGEVNTSEIVSNILRSGKPGSPCQSKNIYSVWEGKTLFVPKIDKSVDGKMDFLRIYGEDDVKALPAGTWGIREPSNEWQSQPRTNGPFSTALCFPPIVSDVYYRI